MVQCSYAPCDSRVAAILTFGCALGCTAPGSCRTASAQELTPRAYEIAPVDSNAVGLGYSRLNGGLDFGGAVPITSATARFNLQTFSYYRALDVLGRSANVAIVVPYGFGEFSGTVSDVPRSLHRSGLLDSFVRFSVNLIGGPAMQPQEFAKWRQDLLVGVTLKIVPPSGQYDPTVLVNLGDNRWAFNSEVGYSQRFGRWVLDAYGAAWFFSENPEYFSRNRFYPGVRSQSEGPVAAFETHLSYDIAPRLWVSFDANFWSGGETSVNGVSNPGTDQKNSRVGFTAALPLTVHQSIKLSLSDGAYIRYGGNYRTVSLVWQYAWIGWPAAH